MTYSVTEAQDKLVELINAVEAGEQVTITRDNKPVVDLVPSKPKQAPKFGTMKDRIFVLDPDWDRPQNDVNAWLRGDV